MLVPDKLFVLRDKGGRYKLNFSDAAPACESMGDTLATLLDIQVSL